ncbi:MAG TPA: hypothetical protein VMI54_27250 [Polyangiaceae bacterium]|nr:hypothetical protein [Polyangiaceae bacterium]
MQDFFLIIHFIGLAMGVGTSFAMMRLGIATKDLPPPERAQFFRRALAITKNGSIGLGLLIVSGLCMLFTRGVGTVFAAGGAAFHAKLTLVLVLIGLLGFSQVKLKRFREHDDVAALAAAAKLGPVMLLTGLGIVTCAVLAFH